MTKINFVTSFNEDIYKTAGHHLLKSIKDNWKPDLKVTCFYHNLDLKNYSIPDNKSITFRQLEKIEEYKTFLDVNIKHDGTDHGAIPYNWRLDATKWCHKVFALTEKAFELAEESADAGWLIWIDADSLAKKRLVTNDILSMLPDSCDVVYKGIRTYPDNPQIGRAHV